MSEKLLVHVPMLVTALSESRALLELSEYFIKLPSLISKKRGTGQPVLVIPGFSTGDSATYLMRWYLREQNFRPEPWNLGINTGPKKVLYTGIVNRIKEITDQYSEPVSLVGWSLGGLFAREIAKEHSSEIRNVVTLGSPFARRFTSITSTEYFKRHGINDLDYLDPERLSQLNVSPPHPCTSIYSKSDSLINWTHCIDNNPGKIDNIEVIGSHFGLCHNPSALIALADRLSQEEDTWTPFKNIDFLS